MEEDSEVVLGEPGLESADEPTERLHIDEIKMKATHEAPTMKGKSKSSRGGGSFKENPYTFLSPDDPILLSCM